MDDVLALRIDYLIRKIDLWSGNLRANAAKHTAEERYDAAAGCRRELDLLADMRETLMGSDDAYIRQVTRIG